jgi:hypothetical protein
MGTLDKNFAWLHLIDTELVLTGSDQLNFLPSCFPYEKAVSLDWYCPNHADDN